jgi:hypothetical protein
LYREIIGKLAAWKRREDRKPLLITGGYGVGKSTAVKMFAEKYYKKLVVIDVMKTTGKVSFDGFLTRDPFDEVMQRYAAEQESKENFFIVFENLNEEKIGKNSAEEIIKFIVRDFMDYNLCIITSLNEKKLCTKGVLDQLDICPLYPVSLKEFLIINGDQKLLECVQNQMRKPLTPEQKMKLKQYLSVYFITGGMPKVIQTYMETRNLDKVNEARKEVYEDWIARLNSIKDENMRKKAKELIQSAAKQLDRPDKVFQYKEMHFFARSKSYEPALTWLTDRQMLFKVTDSEEPSRCKLYLSDVGLLSWMYGLQYADVVTASEFYSLKNNALAEQFVLQHLMLSEMKGDYLFWRTKDQKEVTFICATGQENIPVVLECCGKQTDVLAKYKETKHPKLALTVTEDGMSWQEQDMQIPIYAVWNV